MVTAEKREAVGYLKTEHRISERRSCEALAISRTAYRYEPLPSEDPEIEVSLAELAAKHPELGFKKFFGLLRRRCD